MKNTPLNSLQPHHLEMYGNDLGKKGLSSHFSIPPGVPPLLRCKPHYISMEITFGVWTESESASSKSSRFCLLIWANSASSSSIRKKKTWAVKPWKNSKFWLQFFLCNNMYLPILLEICPKFNRKWEHCIFLCKRSIIRNGLILEAMYLTILYLLEGRTLRLLATCATLHSKPILASVIRVRTLFLVVVVLSGWKLLKCSADGGGLTGGAMGLLSTIILRSPFDKLGSNPPMTTLSCCGCRGSFIVAFTEDTTFCWRGPMLSPANCSWSCKSRCRLPLRFWWFVGGKLGLDTDVTWLARAGLFCAATYEDGNHPFRPR